jgi:ribonuclease HI
MKHTAVGIYRLPFVRIGGHRIIQPPTPLLTHVQTDASFRSKTDARVATLIYPALGPAHYSISAITAGSSTEAEWAAVAAGLQAAIDDDHEVIGVDNDNLSVISGLMFPANPLRHAYARHYRSTILQLANQTLWTAVRWIPRELNGADRLMR